MKCHDWIFLMFTTIICCTATISIAQVQQRGRVKFAVAPQKDGADTVPNRDAAPKPSRPRSSAPRASSRFRATEQPAIQAPLASVESKETSRAQHRSSASRSRSDDRSSRKLDVEATEQVPSIRSRKRVNSVPQDPIPPSDQPTKVQLPTATIDRTNIIRRGKSRSEAAPTSASPPNASQPSHFRRRSDSPAEESTESVRKVRNFSSRIVTSRADDEVSSELPVIVTTAKNNWRNAGSKRGSAKAKISERLPKALGDDQLEDENYPEHFKLLLKQQNPKPALAPRNLPRPPVSEEPSYSRSNEVYDSTKTPARQRRLEHASQESSDEIPQVSRAIPQVRRVELKREDSARAALKSRRVEPPAEEVTKSESVVKAPLKSRRTEPHFEALKSRRNDLSVEELSPKREETSRAPFKSRRNEPQTDAKPNEIIEATKPSKPLFVPRRAEPYRPKPTSTTPRSTTTLKSSRKPEALDVRQKYKPRVNARLQFPTLKTKITSEDVSKGENEIANVKPSAHPIRPPHITKSKNLSPDTPLVDSKKSKSQKFSSRYRGDAYSRYHPKTESSKPVYTPTIPAVSTEPNLLQTDLPSSRTAKSVNLYNPEYAALVQPPNDMNSGVVFDEKAGVWNMVEPVADGLTRSDISVDSSEEHPPQPSSVTVSIFEALADILSKTPPTTSSTSISTTTTTTTTSTTELPEIIQVPEIKIDSMQMSSTTVNTHLITDADGENTTTNEITNNDRNGRILNSVDINQKQSTTTASNDSPTEPTTVPQYTATAMNTDTSPPLTTQTEQTTTNDLTDSTLLLAPTTQPTFTNNIPTNFSANSFELTTLGSNPPTSLPMPFLADALTTPGSSLITRPQLISAISNFLDTSVQNASETMATNTTTTTTATTNTTTTTTTTTATLDTDTEQSTTSDASTTLSPPPTTTFTPSSTDTPPVTISFLDLFTIQPKKVNSNTEPAVEVHPIYKEPDPYTTPVSRQQETTIKDQTSGRPVNILTFFGTGTYPSIAVTGATSTDRIEELTTAFFDSVTSGVTTDSPLPLTTSREQDSTTHTTPQSTSRTQSLPIHLNSILGSTQKYDQTSPLKTVHTTESTTTVRSRFGNNRLPILPPGSVPHRNTTTSTTSSTTTTKTTSSSSSSSSTATTKTTTAETVTQTSPKQPQPSQLSNFIPDQQVPKPIKDFSVYGILPNNTVVRKRPTQVSRTLDVGLMVYGILPNRTVVRKYPNGTLAIVDSTQDVEVVDIDPQMLFNPFSELYRTSQSSLLLTTHRSTTSHRLIEANRIVEVPSSTTSRWANSIKDATDSGSTEATTTNSDDDDANLIQLLSENEDNLLNSTSLVEANTENAVLLDILKRKYINTDIPSRSSNVVSLTALRNLKQKSSIPANRDKNVSENTLSDSSEEKKKDSSSSSSEENLLGNLFPSNGSTGPNRSNTDDDNVISNHFDTFANIGSIFTGNKGRALQFSQRTKLYPIKLVMASQNTTTKLFPIHTSQSATSVKNDSRSVIEAFLAEANRSHGVSAKSSVDGSKTVMPLRDGESKMIDFGVLESEVYSEVGGVYLLDHKDRFEGIGVKGELFEGSGDDVEATTESEKKHSDTWKYSPDSIPVQVVYSRDYEEFGDTEGVSTTEMGSGDFDTPKSSFMYNLGEVSTVANDIAMKSTRNLTTTPTLATHHPIEPEYFIPVEVVYPDDYFEQLPKYLEHFAHMSTTVPQFSETDSSKFVHHSTSISITTLSPTNSDDTQLENVIFEPKLSKSDQHEFPDSFQQNYSEILTSDVNSDLGPVNTLSTKNVVHSSQSNSEEPLRNDELPTSTIISKMSDQFVSTEDAINTSTSVTSSDTISENSSDKMVQIPNLLLSDMATYLGSKLLSVSDDGGSDLNYHSINGSTSDKVSKSSTDNYSASAGNDEFYTSTKSSKTSNKFESNNNEVDSILSNVLKDSQILNKSADVTISDTWSETNPNDSNLDRMPSVSDFLGNYDTDSVENVLIKIETDFDDENPMHDSSTSKTSNADHTSLEDEGLLRLPNFDTLILTKSTTESNLSNSFFSSEFDTVPNKNESKLEYPALSKFPNFEEKATSDPISADDWVTWANISTTDMGNSNSGLNLDEVGDVPFKTQSKVDQKSESIDVKKKSLNLEQSSEILAQMANASHTEVQAENFSNDFELSSQTSTEATRNNFDLSHSDSSEDENLQEKFIIVAKVELSEQLAGNSNLTEHKAESGVNQSIKNSENKQSDTVWVEAKSSAISRDSQYDIHDEVRDDAEGGDSLPVSEIEESTTFKHFNSSPTDLSTYSGIENPYLVSSPISDSTSNNTFSKPDALVPMSGENSTVSEYAQQPSGYPQKEPNDSKEGFALLDNFEYLNSFSSTQTTFDKSSENKSAPSQVSFEEISSFDPQIESQIQTTHVSDIQETSTERIIKIQNSSPNLERLNNLGEWIRTTDVPSFISTIQMTNPVSETFYASTELNLESSINQSAVKEDSDTIYRTNYDSLQNSGQLSTTTKSPSHLSTVQMLQQVSVPSTNKEQIEEYSDPQAENLILRPKSDFDIRSYHNLSTAENKKTIQEDSQHNANNFEQTFEMSVPTSNESDDNFKVEVSTESEIDKISSDLQFRPNFLEPFTGSLTTETTFAIAWPSTENSKQSQNSFENLEQSSEIFANRTLSLDNLVPERSEDENSKEIWSHNNFEQSVQISEKGSEIGLDKTTDTTSEIEFKNVKPTDPTFDPNILEFVNDPVMSINNALSKNFERGQNFSNNFELDQKLSANTTRLQFSVPEMVAEKQPENENPKDTQHRPNNFEQSSKISVQIENMPSQYKMLTEDIINDDNADLEEDPKASADENSNPQLERNIEASGPDKFSDHSTGSNDKSFLETTTAHPIQQYSDQKSKIPVQIENMPFQYKMSMEDINDDDTDFEDEPKASFDENSNPQLERNVKTSAQVKVSDFSTDSHDKGFLHSTTQNWVTKSYSQDTHPPAVYYPMNMAKKSPGVKATFVMPTNMQTVIGSTTEGSRVAMVFPKNAKPQLNAALPGHFHKMYTEEGPQTINESGLKSDSKLAASPYEHNSYVPVNVIYPPQDFRSENKPQSVSEQLNLTATTVSSKIETAFVSDRLFDLPKEPSLFEVKSSSKFDLTALVPKKKSESPKPIFVPGGIPLEMLTTSGDFFETETKPTSADKMFVPGGVPQDLLITTEANAEAVPLSSESPFENSPVEKTTAYTDSESSFNLESIIQDESGRLSDVRNSLTLSNGETRKVLDTIPTIESFSTYKATEPNHPKLILNSSHNKKPVLELKPSSDNLPIDISSTLTHESSQETTKDEFKANKMSMNFLESPLAKVEYEVKGLKENFQNTFENSSTRSPPIYQEEPRGLQQTFQEAVENVVESHTSDSKQLNVNSQTSVGQQVPSDVSQKLYFKSESFKTDPSTSPNRVEQTTDHAFDSIITRLPTPQYLISNPQPKSRNKIKQSNTTPSFVHQMSENALANIQTINSAMSGKSSNISISERDPSLMVSLNNPTTEENLSDSDQNHSATTSISQIPQLSSKIDMESWTKSTPPEVLYMAMNPAVEAQTRNHTETQYTTQHQYTNFHESSTLSSLDNNNIVIDNLKNSINTITEPKRIDSIPTTPAVIVVTPGTTSSTTKSTTIPSSTTSTTTTTPSTTTSSTTPPTTTTTTTLAPPTTTSTTTTTTTTTSTTTTTPLPTTVSTTPSTSTTNESPQTAAQASMAIGELERNIKLLQELLGLQASLKPTSSSSSTSSSTLSTTTTTTPLPPSTKTTTTTTAANKAAATSGGDDVNFLNTLRQLLLAQQQATKKPNTPTTTTPKTTMKTTATPITISPQNLEDLLNSFSTPSFSTTAKTIDQDDTAFLNSLRDIGKLRVTTSTPPTFANRIIELALQNRQATPTPMSPVYIPARVSTTTTPAFTPLPNVKRPAILPPEEIERHRKDQASLSADLSLLSTLLGRRITAADLPQITQQFGGNKQSVSAPRRPTTTPRTTPRTTRTTTTTTEKPMSRNEIAEIEKNLNLLSSLLGRPVSLNELPLIMQDLRSGRKTSGARINQINAITAKTTTTTLRPRPTISLQSQTPISQEEVIQLLKDPSFSASPDQLNIYGKSNDAVLAAVLKQRGIGPTNNNIPINDLFLQGPTPTPYHTTRAPPAPPQPPATQRRPLLDGLAWLWRAWQDTAPGTRPSRNNRQPVAAASTRLESPLTIGVFGGAQPAPPATSNSGEGGEYAELQYPQNPNPSFGQGNGLLTAAFGVTRAVTQFLGAAFQGAAKSVQSAFSPQAVQQNRILGLSG